jgi:hypothetical protein
MAKLFKITQNFEDMIEVMNEVIAENVDLTKEEIKLLSVAY